MLVTAPEGYKPEEGKPISFEIPDTSIDLTKIVPKELATKEYFKNIKTTDDLFKSLDGAQTMLGKPRYGTPKPDAPKEEWDQFYAAIGRPEKPDAYEFEIDPKAPKEISGSPEYHAKVKALLHSAGITPSQAKLLQKGMDALTMEQYTAHKAEQEKVDKEFDALMAASFGDKKDEKIGRAKAIFEKMLPKEMAQGINKLSNDQLQLMAVFANIMADKYMKEDEIPSSGGAGATTAAELKKQMQDKQIEISKLDSMDPKKAILKQEISAIALQLSKL